MIDVRNAILDILQIIDYDKDKEDFIGRFVALAETDALTNAIKSLPEHRRTPLIHLVNATHRRHELFTILKRYITTEAYLRHLEQSINDLFLDYLKTLDKSLDKTTMNKVEEYLSNLTLQKG